MVLGESVPVFDATAAVGSEEVAALMADHVTSGASIGIIRGHGPFAIAETLQDAYRLVSCLEHSAELLTLFEMTGRAKK
jgi:ribulose-5-phosphate 4-epimerase/fuculose-1-phosphate aldolase